MSRRIKLYLLTLALLCPLHAIHNIMAAGDAIAAIVDNVVITEHELRERKELMSAFRDGAPLDTKMHAAVLDQLIVEKLLNAAYSEGGANASKEDAIAQMQAMEQRAQMPRGSLLQLASKHNISSDAVLQYCAGVAIQNKIGKILASKTTLNITEVKDFVSMSNNIEHNATVRVIAKKDNSKISPKIYTKLKQMVKSRHDISRYIDSLSSDFVVSEITTRTANLDSETKSIIDSLRYKVPSNIVQTKNGGRIFVYISSEPYPVTMEQLAPQANAVHQKKFMLALENLISSIRERAYIKIMHKPS